MRRSAAAAALVLALAASVTSVAGAKGGNLQVSVPAPAVGQAVVRLVTFHIKGKAPKLKLKIGNLAALGKGFDAVAAVSAPKTPSANETVKVFIVMFMGNLSTSPASTINLQTNIPSGEVKTSQKDETKDCATIKGVDELELGGAKLFLLHLGDGESPPGSFMHNTTSYLCPK